MELDRGWSRAARFWGIAAGVGFAVSSILDLEMCSGGWLRTARLTPQRPPARSRTIVHWAAVFAYRNATLWDVMLRDALFFFSFLGILPLFLAANAATGGRRAAVQISGAFAAVAAVFGAAQRGRLLWSDRVLAGRGLGGRPGNDHGDRGSLHPAPR